MNSLNASLIEQLNALAKALATNDLDRLYGALERIAPAQLFSFPVMVAAIGVGKAPLVSFLATLGRENTTDTDRFESILDASLKAQRSGSDSDDSLLNLSALSAAIWNAYLGEAGDSAAGERAASLAEACADNEARWLAGSFLLNIGRPADALALLSQIRAELGEKTPPEIVGKIVTALHLCGDYAEAESFATDSLGVLQEKLRFDGEVQSEEVLLANSGGGADPVVSILCSTYNHERYIEKAIQGFLIQQTRFPFEILIHDDASTDGTADIVRKWHERYPTIIKPIFQSENQFSQGRRGFDLMLKRSRGRYIATCEGDDFWIKKDKLERQVSFLEANPDFVSTTHNYYVYDESKVGLGLWYRPELDEREFSARELMGLRRFLWHQTLVFRKLFDTLPPEREFAAMGDSFMTSYLGSFGKAMSFERFIGSVRRLNPYSIWTPLSANKKEYMRVKTRYALVRMYERMGKHQAVGDLKMLIQAAEIRASEKEALERESRSFAG